MNEIADNRNAAPSPSGTCQEPPDHTVGRGGTGERRATWQKSGTSPATSVPSYAMRPPGSSVWSERRKSWSGPAAALVNDDNGALVAYAERRGEQWQPRVVMRPAEEP